MLQISHVTKYYVKSKPVISDLSLSFGDVGLNVIIGKSGCGKTTLLNMIGTMDQDYIGSIEFNEVELSTISYDKISNFRNYDSAYIFQLHSLFEDLTVNQNIEMVLNLQNKSADIDAILDKVGLSGFGNRKVKYLSGGERQRVAIARAIAKDCKILLADEPTSALDSANSHKILALLKEISKDRLVILVTHDTKKAQLYADRIIRMVDGRIVKDTTINEVTGKPVEVKRKLSKPKTLKPIFFSQFRKTFVMNLFITLLLSIAITMTNIAIEDGKILKEYDIIEGEKLFNETRVLNTHVANDVDFYNIIPRGSINDPYEYFKEYKSDNGGLFQEDINTLTDYFKGYNIHQGNNRGNIIIEDVSVILTISQDANSMKYYWDEPQRSPYKSYVYSASNQYNLIAGRTPTREDEIMITDTIAKEYLLRNDFDASNLADVMKHKLTIFDIYHTIPSVWDPNADYYYTEEKQFKIVGVIGTNQFGFFDYNSQANRYDLNKSIKTQNENRNQPYLNSKTTYPHGYVVTYKELDSYRTETHFEDEYQVKGILLNKMPLDNPTIATFTGVHDYRGINSNNDNLLIDRYFREIEFTTTNDVLVGNEIILTDAFIRYMNPGVSLRRDDEIRNFYLETLANTEITLSFEGQYQTITKTFTIVGVAESDSSFPGEPGYFYFSEEVLDELVHMDDGFVSAFTVELNGADVNQRLKMINDLYEMGYIMSPINTLPGAYLEFVTDQGEMILTGSDGYGDLVNLSFYHLFSPFYNTEVMNGVNSVLEIVSSIYTFILVMAFVLSGGFIFLKEHRQKLEIMKLTQIGVKTNKITSMNIISYAMIAVLMGVISLFGTMIFVGIINDAFVLEIVGNDGVGLISRFRLLFTSSSVLISIAVSIITFILCVITTSYSVNKSKR